MFTRIVLFAFATSFTMTFLTAGLDGQTTDSPDTPPGQDALVNVTFRNGYEGWGVMICLKNSDGSIDAYKELKKYESATLQAYPGNVWVFRAKVKEPGPNGSVIEKWTKIPFDEYVTSEEIDQEHFCHDDSHLTSRIVDGRELVFRNKIHSEIVFQWASKGHAQFQTPHFRAQKINSDSKYIWIAHQVTDTQNDIYGWALELKDDGRFLSVTDVAKGKLGLQKLAKTGKHIDVVNGNSELLQRSIWDFTEFAYLHENGKSTMGFSKGICLRNSFISSVAKKTGEPDKSVLSKEPMTGQLFLAKMGPSLHVGAAQFSKPMTLGWVPVPWGRYASAAPAVTMQSGYDFFLWLKQDQPEYRSGRSGMNESLGAGFLGDLLGNEIHSLTGYNIHYLDPLNLQDHGLKGRRLSNGKRNGLSALPHLFANIDPNVKNTYYITGSYRVPEFFFMLLNKEQRMEGSTSMFFSENELQESMSMSVGVKGKAGNPKKKGIAGGGKCSYSETRRKVSTENRVARLKSKWASDFWLTLDKSVIKLDTGFSEYLLDPNNKFKTYEDYEDLFARFGTHYPLSVLYGGRHVEESYLEASSVMESMETKFEASGNVEGGAKGVSGGVSGSYSVGNLSASKIETSKENTVEHSVGGDGFGEVWTKGDSKNFAPIKVDLRPICDIIRPELFSKNLTEADVLKIHGIRSRCYWMLDKYLVQEGYAPSQQNKSPKMFVASVNYVKCIKADDALNVSNHAPDIYGQMSLGSARRIKKATPETVKVKNALGIEQTVLRTHDWIFDNNIQWDDPKDVPWTTVTRISEADAVSLDRGQTMTDANNTRFEQHTFGVYPTMKNSQIGGKQVTTWEYDLENEFATFSCNLNDLDNSGHDKFRMTGDEGIADKLIKLSDVMAENGSKTVTFKTSHPNAGELEISVTVRAIEISFNDSDSLPKAPYGD